jgi:hypothetical protein
MNKLPYCIKIITSGDTAEVYADIRGDWHPIGMKNFRGPHALSMAARYAEKLAGKYKVSITVHRVTATGRVK